MGVGGGHSLVGYYTRDRRRENSSLKTELPRCVAGVAIARASSNRARDAFLRDIVKHHTLTHLYGRIAPPRRARDKGTLGESRGRKVTGLQR
jgi:hypothetical protein